MKQKFIEWFTKNNNGCSPAMEDDRSFVHEKTQHMFEAYLAGVAEGEAKCAALAAEMAWLKKFCKDAAFDADYEAELGMERGGFTDALNNIKTPATDAYLDEVRAQGVEMAAQSEQFSTWVQQGLRSFAIGVRQGDECAAQLRKGVQS
ncbi:MULTISPECIES: hypothetical protein [Enterobacter cloacae complex]|uniref:hypothetical protein n=1 Tax=Enterobacter cloacae complex TaxID=354276 RepID=UPI001F166734|nr:hypothetical protein [Enterobacter cloacae]